MTAATALAHDRGRERDRVAGRIASRRVVENARYLAVVSANRPTTLWPPVIGQTFSGREAGVRS